MDGCIVLSIVGFSVFLRGVSIARVSYLYFLGLKFFRSGYFYARCPFWFYLSNTQAIGD